MRLGHHFIVSTIFGGLFIVSLASVFALQWPSLLERFPVPSVHQMQEEEIDTSEWLTYRDEELGIEFEYPASQTADLIKLERSGEKIGWITLGGGTQILFNTYEVKNQPQLINQIDAGTFIYTSDDRLLSADSVEEATKKISKVKQYKISNLTKHDSGNLVIWSFDETYQNKISDRKIFYVSSDDSNLILSGIFHDTPIIQKILSSFVLP